MEALALVPTTPTNATALSASAAPIANAVSNCRAGLTKMENEFLLRVLKERTTTEINTNQPTTTF